MKIGFFGKNEVLTASSTYSLEIVYFLVSLDKTLYPVYLSDEIFDFLKNLKDFYLKRIFGIDCKETDLSSLFKRIPQKVSNEKESFSLDLAFVFNLDYLSLVEQISRRLIFCPDFLDTKDLNSLDKITSTNIDLAKRIAPSSISISTYSRNADFNFIPQRCGDIPDIKPSNFDLLWLGNPTDQDLEILSKLDCSILIVSEGPDDLLKKLQLITTKEKSNIFFIPYSQNVGPDDFINCSLNAAINYKDIKNKINLIRLKSLDIPIFVSSIKGSLDLQGIYDINEFKNFRKRTLSRNSIVLDKLIKAIVDGKVNDASREISSTVKSEESYYPSFNP